jgi:hypothetical protein
MGCIRHVVESDVNDARVLWGMERAPNSGRHASVAMARDHDMIIKEACMHIWAMMELSLLMIVESWRTAEVKKIVNIKSKQHVILPGPGRSLSAVFLPFILAN